MEARELRERFDENSTNLSDLSLDLKKNAFLGVFNPDN